MTPNPTIGEDRLATEGLRINVSTSGQLPVVDRGGPLGCSMYRTSWMLGSSSLGRWGRSVAPLAVLLALAAAASLPGQAQVENTHEGAIAVLGPDSGGPAYEFAAQVLAQALGGIHVPVMTRGVPVPTPPHPGIVFLLPQTVDGDRLSALRRFRDDGGRIVTFGVQDEAISEMLGLTCRMESDPLPQPLRVIVEERHLPGQARLTSTRIASPP